MAVVDQLPKCTCGDVNQCDTWCKAKQLFTEDRCDHRDYSTVVLEIVANCEKTANQCDYCGKIITEPKTDCR